MGPDRLGPPRLDRAGAAAAVHPPRRDPADRVRHPGDGPLRELRARAAARVHGPGERADRDRGGDARHDRVRQRRLGGARAAPLPAERLEGPAGGRGRRPAVHRPRVDQEPARHAAARHDARRRDRAGRDPAGPARARRGRARRRRLPHPRRQPGPGRRRLLRRAGHRLRAARRGRRRPGPRPAHRPAHRRPARHVPGARARRPGPEHARRPHGTACAPAQPGPRRVGAVVRDRRAHRDDAAARHGPGGPVRASAAAAGPRVGHAAVGAADAAARPGRLRAPADRGPRGDPHARRPGGRVLGRHRRRPQRRRRHVPADRDDQRPRRLRRARPGPAAPQAQSGLPGRRLPPHGRPDGAHHPDPANRAVRTGRPRAGPPSARRGRAGVRTPRPGGRSL